MEQDAQQFFAQYNALSQQIMTAANIANGNVLQFNLPGVTHPLRVKFPDFRLPVCEKCKKNYKTRDMCRLRNGHTELPWSPVYICITLDNSCIDENTGKLYTNVPFTVRANQWQPYCIHKDKVATYFDAKTPICATCKKKNYTRSFCRERHRHRSLPWSTVYVTLSVMEGMTPSDNANVKASAVNAADSASTAVDVNEAAVQAAITAATYLTDTASANGTTLVDGTLVGTLGDQHQQEVQLTDDLSHMDEISRTVLLRLSAKESTLQWVEFDESETNAFGGYANTSGRNPVAGSTNPYLNFGSNNYLGASYPNPMQMAQFFAAFANPTGSADGDVHGSEEASAMQQQYQQYMNWQAQMWYHQQAQLANAGTGTTTATNEEGVNSDVITAKVEEDDEEGQEFADSNDVEGDDNGAKRTKRV